MGTDIHLIAEARDDNGRWQLVPGPIEDCWHCRGKGIIDAADFPHARQDWIDENHGTVCDFCSEMVSDWDADDYPNTKMPNPDFVQAGKRIGSWYDDRNYVAFALLNNVRNGSGFAGCDTGDPVLPISGDDIDRGLPDDLSDAGVLWFHHHGGDHSDHWLSLREVLEYNWDAPIIKRGVVDLQQYKAYKEGRELTEWCGSASGGMVRNVSNTEMDRLISGDTLVDSDLRYYTQIQWVGVITDYAGRLLDQMKMLAITVGERDTRIVFNFDS